MFSKALLISLLPAVLAQETVYGVYIFSRHGDRTSKSTPPANLTGLGYEQVLSSGSYYRSRYISSGASLKVSGLNSDIVKQSQLTVTAPSDTVLQNSAAAFLQGIYPPVPTTETLRNGTVVTTPFGGYQLIPIGLVSAGTGSEDNTWLQDASGCVNAARSSANYYTSADYLKLLNSTQSFYTRIAGVVNRTFTADATNFKNAYTIFDLINVAEIHNASIQDSQLLDNSTLYQLRTLADSHEWGLAWNASDKVRAIPGMQLAAEVVKYLNGTITGGGKQKLGIQFGAYASFLSFFGLANLTAASGDFAGVPDYASSMAFELFSSAPLANGSALPAVGDLQVRFLFANGSASNASAPKLFPLFGGAQTALPWTTFVAKMNSFAVGTTEQWCGVCGNTVGSCAAYVNNSSPASGSGASGSSAGSSGHKGMSAAVGGVIGACVTLAVILGLEALVLLAAGLKVVSKKRAGAGAPVNGAEKM